MAAKDTGRNIMVDALAAACPYMSLHTGFPATTGNEVTGGSPAYTREPITYAASSAGAKAVNGTLPVFDVPSGTTIMAVGFCTAVTGGTIHADDDIVNEIYGGQGTYTASSAVLTVT